MSVSLEPIVIVRRSRSGNKQHPHVIHLDPQMLTPIDPGHPCSCAAGTKGNWCWAILGVLRDAPKFNPHPGVAERAHQAAQVLAAREAEAARKKRRTR
jgi:hypothetical protein